MSYWIEGSTYLLYVCTLTRSVRRFDVPLSLYSTNLDLDLSMIGGTSSASQLGQPRRPTTVTTVFEDVQSGKNLLKAWSLVSSILLTSYASRQFGRHVGISAKRAKRTRHVVRLSSRTTWVVGLLCLREVE